MVDQSPDGSKPESDCGVGALVKVGQQGLCHCLQHVSRRDTVNQRLGDTCTNMKLEDVKYIKKYKQFPPNIIYQ